MERIFVNMRENQRVMNSPYGTSADLDASRSNSGPNNLKNGNAQQQQMEVPNVSKLNKASSSKGKTGAKWSSNADCANTGGEDASGRNFVRNGSTVALANNGKYQNVHTNAAMMAAPYNGGHQQPPHSAAGTLQHPSVEQAQAGLPPHYPLPHYSMSSYLYDIGLYNKTLFNNVSTAQTSSIGCSNMALQNNPEHPIGLLKEEQPDSNNDPLPNQSIKSKKGDLVPDDRMESNSRSSNQLMKNNNSPDKHTKMTQTEISTTRGIPPEFMAFMRDGNGMNDLKNSFAAASSNASRSLELMALFKDNTTSDDHMKNVSSSFTSSTGSTTTTISGASTAGNTTLSLAALMSTAVVRHPPPLEPSDRRPYSCDTCFKCFTTSGNLKQHIVIHSGEKVHTCEYCPKSFNHSSNLKEHLRIHTGERPYTCDVCEKTFVRSGSLREHMRRHTGERPYICIVCHKAFSTSSNLKQHLTIHSGVKHYTCSVCLKSFNHSSNLKEHLRIHSGERPFSCHICNKSFCKSSNLNKHMSIHSGELAQKNYSCTVCSKTFSRATNARQHTRKYCSGSVFVGGAGQAGQEGGGYCSNESSSSSPSRVPQVEVTISEQQQQQQQQQQPSDQMHHTHHHHNQHHHHHHVMGDFVGEVV
ncbi:zinc finger protein 3 homolog [Nilaparvata lugens]|uniref:zinc finger protein 3 homolog n=1 Tax=Nilaparvata lugens TaxID=108931 RepID=UPI000B98DC25|nr:zinc finger protein 3 homolog [Nilaparvata lugens]XP_022186250.1 zinc finger protein 3 homolog [Nilaparvata lugens]